MEHTHCIVCLRKKQLNFVKATNIYKVGGKRRETRASHQSKYSQEII